MLDASVVVGCRPEEPYNRSFFVAGPHNFGRLGLAVPGEFEACTLGACLLAG